MCRVLDRKYVLHDPLEDESSSSEKQVQNTNEDHQIEKTMELVLHEKKTRSDG